MKKQRVIFWLAFLLSLGVTLQQTCACNDNADMTAQEMREARDDCIVACGAGEVDSLTDLSDEDLECVVACHEEWTPLIEAAEDLEKVD
jgi:hypothetical protein